MIESRFNYYLRNTIIFVVWFIVNCMILMIIGTMLTIVLMFFAFLDCLERLIGGRRGGNRPQSGDFLMPIMVIFGGISMLFEFFLILPGLLI